MQLIKDNIEHNLVKETSRGKVTLDKDFNVPDSKEDISRIIVVKGEPVVEEWECMVDRVKLKGHIHFCILYATENANRPLECMEGELAFTESVHMEGVLPTDTCNIQLEMEDLTVSIINSRKIIAKALVGYTVNVSGDEAWEVTTELENANDVECLYKKLAYTKRVVDKKDIFRIKQEMELPPSKPNIGEIIWHSVNMNALETKLVEQAIQLSGELSVFVIYQAEEGEQPLQYLSMEIPVSGSVDLSEANLDMMAVINSRLEDVEMLIRPDMDGEERRLETSASLNMDIQLYEEKQMMLLEDVFAPNVELKEHCIEAEYENIIMKNSAKTRVAERIHLNKSQDKIMQICQVEGSVKIDEELVTEEGLQVEGVVLATIIYVVADDRQPISSIEAMVPFSYLVEMKNLKENARYEIAPQLEQLSAIMIDSDEIELKAQVDMNIVAFARGKVRGIDSIEVQPLSYDKIKQLPAMAGYYVKEGDTLWSIAKKYYTTIDSIRQINHLEQDHLMPGQKLLIVKC